MEVFKTNYVKQKVKENNKIFTVKDTLHSLSVRIFYLVRVFVFLITSFDSSTSSHSFTIKCPTRNTGFTLRVDHIANILSHSESVSQFHWSWKLQGLKLLLFFYICSYF